MPFPLDLLPRIIPDAHPNFRRPQVRRVGNNNKKLAPRGVFDDSGKSY
jgi:hypothetical protein